MRVHLRPVDDEWELWVPELGDVPVRLHSLADLHSAVDSLATHLGIQVEEQVGGMAGRRAA